MLLGDKVVIVAGIGPGLGRAIAVRASEEGGAVALVSSARLAHLRGIGHRSLAGVAAAHVERGAAPDQRLAAKQGRARRARGGVVRGDDAVRKVAPSDLVTQRFEPRLARGADEGQLRRAFQKEVDGVIQPGPAPRFSRTAISTPEGPCFPGQHTDQVLADAGLTELRIEELRRGGVVA